MRYLPILKLLGCFVVACSLNQDLAQEPRTEDCPPNAICDPPRPRKFDEYHTLSWNAEKTRLDNVAILLKAEDSAVGLYLVGYEGRNGCVGNVWARNRRAKEY